MSDKTQVIDQAPPSGGGSIPDMIRALSDAERLMQIPAGSLRSWMVKRRLLDASEDAHNELAAIARDARNHFAAVKTSYDKAQRQIEAGHLVNARQTADVLAQHYPTAADIIDRLTRLEMRLNDRPTSPIQ